MSSEDAANDIDSCVANERELKMAEDSWDSLLVAPTPDDIHLSRFWIIENIYRFLLQKSCCIVNPKSI